MSVYREKKSSTCNFDKISVSLIEYENLKVLKTHLYTCDSYSWQQTDFESSILVSFDLVSRFWKFKFMKIFKLCSSIKEKKWNVIIWTGGRSAWSWCSPSQTTYPAERASLIPHHPSSEERNPPSPLLRAGGPPQIITTGTGMHP